MAGPSGGAPDAILDSENGHVVDGRLVVDVAERVSQLLLDGELSRGFGERGQAWVGERWVWDQQAERLRELLDPSGH